METDAPQPSEWSDEVEGESRIDMPMKQQVTDEPMSTRGVGT